MFTFLYSLQRHPRRRSTGGWGWQGLLTLLLLLVSASALAEKTVTTTYYYTDVLGSVVATADEQGTVRSRRTYQPYGAIHAPDPTDTEALGYTGKPLDASGLQYFGARYFDPRLGRFMGIDPVGFDPAQPFSFNRYAYANNNPYRYVDPDGMEAIIAFVPALGVDIDTMDRISHESTKGVAIGGLVAVAILASPKFSGKQVVDEVVEDITKITSRPSKFRKKTIQDAWDNAADGSKLGTKACPTCGRDVEVAPGKGPRDWHVDHQPKWKDRDLSGMTRKQVLDEYNKNVRLRCPHCNMSDN